MGTAVISLLVVLTVAAAESANLVRDAPDARPTLRVDSTYAGYAADVLTDGRWVELGKEITQDYGSRDRLGNSGNSWVSAAVEGVEHWVRLDWPRAVELNQVSIWWTQPPWYPKAFRVEFFRDGAWIPATSAGDWWVPTQQHSTATFPAVTTASLRVVQHPGGGPDRGFLAVQEVAVFHQPQAAGGLLGARPLVPEELQTLTPARLERNLARLHVDQPGADEALVWTAAGATGPQPRLQDGDVKASVALPDGVLPGVAWPIQHVLDGGAVFFSEGPPKEGSLVVEIHDGERWAPLHTGLQVAADATRRCLAFTCEPVATTGVRFQLAAGWPTVTEIELYRYLPARPDVWPERLVTGNRFERELLAGGREPSFAGLSTAALSMVPTYALLGLKDAPREIGVTWDGTVVSQWPIRFSFGVRPQSLAACRDTVMRTLVDDWRPGVVVQGQLRDLRVTQTAFVSFAGPNRTKPALFVQIELANLGSSTLETAVHARVDAWASELKFVDGALTAKGRAVLVVGEGWSLGESGRIVRTLKLPPGGKQTEKLVQPCDEVAEIRELAAYRQTDWAAALSEFRRYWDEMLAPAAAIEVPEAHVVNMVRAVLTQLMINADGDIVPYGSDPSWYSGRLYGVEEGYAMMALAQAGFLNDAQRYMDGTYLTPQFLVKVPEYKKYEDRHQQYRNGLQPHYAVSAYRLSRDRTWIERHLPLLRQCAEWTLAERRKTMVLENGERPLHYGLLPKWSYGGDISELQCYALYANFACWKGLVDTAWLLQELGDLKAAERYRADADDYWQSIERAVEGNYRREHQPPFLPLQLYADQPVGDDYDQLFAGTLLHLHAWDPAGRQIRYVTDFLEQDNRTFCLLPRFRRDVGAGGLDGLYGLGYILTKLQQDRIDEFLLGFYGYLAFNLERSTFAARETNLIYASDLHLRSRYKVPEMSDPVPCSAAVAVQLLRHMLVTETRPAPDQPADGLRLLAGAPRAWLADGRTIRLQRLPTEFGMVSLEVVSSAAQGRIEASIEPPKRNPCNAVQLRLRDPQGRRLVRVRVNGRPLSEFDADRDLIRLPPGSGEYRVVAEFAEPSADR